MATDVIPDSTSTAVALGRYTTLAVLPQHRRISRVLSNLSAAGVTSHVEGYDVVNRPCGSLYVAIVVVAAGVEFEFNTGVGVGAGGPVGGPVFEQV